MRNATKKENGITVRPKKVRFERKRRIVDIPKKRAAKIPKGVGFANNKKAEAAKFTISKKVKEEENNVIGEVVDGVKMDNVTSFTTNIPVYQIFEIEFDDEEVDEKPLPRSALTYGDLKLISNNRMLTDIIINAAHNVIHLQHPNIAELQDTYLAKVSIPKMPKTSKVFVLRNFLIRLLSRFFMMAIYIG